MCFGCRTKVLLMNEIILLYSNYIFHPETVCCSYRKNIICITIYHCVTIKKIKIEKIMIINLTITQIIFGNMNFKDNYHMSNSED